MIEASTLLIDQDPISPAEWNPQLPHHVYHADKTRVGSSSLRKILKSPRSFYDEFFLQQAREETPEMRFGSYFHVAFLEPKKFKETFIIQPDFGDLRIKINKEKKQEWERSLKPNQALISQEDHDCIQRMLESAWLNKDVKNLIEFESRHATSEVSILYTDIETRIRCKARPDFFRSDIGLLLDLKTTRDCRKEEFSKSIWFNRYDFQMAMYAEATEILTNKKPYCLFLAIEKTPPYEIALYECEPGIIDRGSRDYHAALRELQACIQMKTWHGVQQHGIETIGLPRWIGE